MQENSTPPDDLIDDDDVTTPRDYSGVIPADAPARQTEAQLDAERLAVAAGRPPDYVTTADLDESVAGIDSPRHYPQGSASSAAGASTFNIALERVAERGGLPPAHSAPAVTITPKAAPVGFGIQSIAGYVPALVAFVGGVLAAYDAGSLDLPGWAAPVLIAVSAALTALTNRNRTDQRNANVGAAATVAAAALAPVSAVDVATGQVVPAEVVIEPSEGVQ